jgi:O-antigen ligase
MCVKWVVLIVALAAIFPFSQWLRRNPREIPKVWMLMGFMPFGLTARPEFDIAIISWAGWPGYVKGLEFSLLDACALAIYISLPRTQHPLPFRLSMAFYFIAVVLSIFQASVPMAAVFYAWQLARVFLVYAVVAKACADERVPSALLTGMALGLAFEACMVVWQRFGLGVTQGSGTLGHQNALGLASHFVVLPLFALLLAGERGWQTIVGPVAGAIIAVLTVSRATLGLAGAGLALVFGLSAIRRWTAQKTRVLLIGAAALVALAPIAISGFERRFAAEPIVGDYDERAAFERAAALILSDHPLGVGANNYVVVANTGGYLGPAGVTWSGMSRTTSVHNAYRLTAAEMGYLGAIAFVLLLLRIISVAMSTGWRHRNDPRGDLLLGLGVSLMIVAIHAYFEWILFLAPIQYLFAFTAGLVAGLTQQLGYRSVSSTTKPYMNTKQLSY